MRLAQLILVLAAAAVAAGALASNMAFKLSVRLLKQAQGGGTGICASCGNWVSLPAVNEFEGKRLFDICPAYPEIQFLSQTGRSLGNGTLTALFPEEIDLLTGPTGCLAFNPAFTPNPLYQPNVPIRVVIRSTVTSDVPALVVGSHDPGRQVLVRTRAGQGGTGVCASCGNWIDLPYHTTAVRLFDLCAENPEFQFIAQPGRSSGLGLNTQLFTEEIDLITGPTNCTAPSPAFTPNPIIQIGRPVRIVTKSSTVGDTLWSPSHY